MLLGVKAVIARELRADPPVDLVCERSRLVFAGRVSRSEPGSAAVRTSSDIELPGYELRATLRGGRHGGHLTHGSRRKDRKIRFGVRCRPDLAVEIDYYRNGGIPQTVLRKPLNESRVTVKVAATV